MMRFSGVSVVAPVKAAVKSLSTAFALLCLVIPPLHEPALGADSNKTDCKMYPLLTDAFPCNLTTISWVEVLFDGKLLKEYKSEFEKLIRLRLRNDLSMISHDYKKYSDLQDEVLKGIEGIVGKQWSKKWDLYNKGSSRPSVGDFGSF